MSVASKTREDTASVTRNTSSSMESEGNSVSSLDETVRLQSEKREERIREVRGQIVQGIAEGTSSAPHLANS